MRNQTYKLVEMALRSDDSVGADDRDAILDFCRDPHPAQPARSGAEDLTLLTPEDVGQRLHVTPRTVRRYIRSGRLRSMKIQGMRRIKMADFLQFLASGTDAVEGTVELKVSPDTGEASAVDHRLQKKAS